MNENSFLARYISTHENWRTELSEYPYFLRIAEEGRFAIFNYDMTQSASIDGERRMCDFSLPEVQEARGIIIDTKTLDVVCWPFRKFGNYGEYYADSIDWSTARVQEKVDGSIMKLWNDGERWRVSTNSAITNDQPVRFGSHSLTDLFWKAAEKQHLDTDRLDPSETYIFELVSPDNTIVIEYPETAIYHIGTRSNVTGEERNEDIGIMRPASYPLHSLDACIDAAGKLNAGGKVNREGYVVVDSHWNRVKVKSPDYVAVHHLLSTMSERKLIEAVLDGEADEIRSYYPQTKDAFDRYERAYARIIETTERCLEEFRNMWESTGHDRKAFAMAVRGMSYYDARLAFRAISGEGAGEVLRKSLRRKELITMVKIESQLHDLHIVCGIPGSGKSTWAAKQKGTVISTDAIRGELFGDESAQYSDSFLRQNGYDPDAMTERQKAGACSRKVFAVAEERAFEAIRTGDVYFDATNISPDGRKSLLESIPHDRAYADIIIVPLKTALERNASRERHVPEDVIRSMHRRFVMPSCDEGFETVRAIYSEKGLEEERHVALRRNARRERHVPEGVIRSMHERFVMPSEEEGVSSVRRIPCEREKTRSKKDRER